MASNFSFFSCETANSIHLVLYGDFDGDSAYQLINALKHNGTDVIDVFIDTNELKQVYPFGVSVFEKKAGALFNKHNNLIFIGKNKNIFRYYGQKI
jgi:hypothetical protein